MCSKIYQIIYKVFNERCCMTLFLKALNDPCSYSVLLYLSCTTDFRCLPEGNEITIASVRHYREQIGHPGSVSSDLAKSRIHGIGGNRIYIFLKFDRRLGNNTAETPVKFQSDWTVINVNLGPSRLHFEILCSDVLYGILKRATGLVIGHLVKSLSAHAWVVPCEDLFECVQNRRTTQNSTEYQVIFNIGNAVRYLDISSAILNYVTSWKQ